MSRISGGLGKCFDTVRGALLGTPQSAYEEAVRALDLVEEAFERRQRWMHEAHAFALRLQGMTQAHIAWLRGLPSTWEPELKQKGDELETQLMTELGNMSLSKLPPKALVELGVAVAAELERRGITAFPVVLGGDGKIQGGASVLQDEVGAQARRGNRLGQEEG